MQDVAYKLETKNIELSDHAYERLRERFPNEAKNKQSATNFTRSVLKNSKYIGILPDQFGVDAHLYVYKSEIAFHIALDVPVLKTVYTIDKQKPIPPFHDKIVKMYNTEFRKLQRKELAIKRKLKYIVAECEAQIASLKLRKLKTRSDNVKSECESEIVKLNNQIWAINQSLKEVQIKKREIAFVIATENY